MKVIATAVGYAGKDGHQLRQPGDVFEVPDGSKATWFNPVDDDAGGQESHPRGNQRGRGRQADSDLA
ncbi:hypothetical protein [Achromobacter pestifer]|uniref:Uncharacterized protein n=1 Tax=Achromobacter pestifer TaxID=1353889 RepID=A0A6S6YI90_9BURK|nr:hypothetical protein [Achromobacter pestifer]CAB3624678.1 hypothetical protein LMG3431_00051 [Achromobacter pestifer]